MIRTTSFLCVLALAACAPNVLGPNDKDSQSEYGAKEDRWNSINDPMRFDGEFNYFAEDLPLEGTAERESWPSTYWPTYEDSINARWQSGELSPAQKYDAAFNGWTPTDEFLALRPFDRDRPVPNEDWDPEYYNQQGPLASLISRSMGNARDRSAAIAEDGRPDEWDVETWWGLCHAWVPAALLEDRPLRAVTHNGVTFEVGDMEALLIAAYNRAPADMIGGRCNVGSGDTEVERDEHGRAVDVECRDSNPGAMHVIVTNYLGMQARGFAMDRTFDYEVWNQPIAGYEITKQEPIDVARANELLGLSGDSYEYNGDATTLYDVNLSLHWITESHASTVPNDTARYTRTDRLTYILEVDAEGKVIGGEWYGRSRSQHPDFLWNPRRLTRSSVQNLDLDMVRMLLEMSRATTEPMPGVGLTADGTGDLAIPDNDSMGVSSVATLGGATGVTATVSVEVSIAHSYVGDLMVVLEHNGVERTLHNREGGSSDDLNKTFDVVGFEGVDPNGAWNLTVSDHAAADVGTLDGWSIAVTERDGEPVTPPPATDTERFAGAGGVAIPDADDNGARSSASVTSTDGAVAIEVAITHTYIGDLRVVVSHEGRSWTLHDQEGGSDDDLMKTFPLDATGNAFEGDPSGEWELWVTDNAGQDLGTIDGWAVIVSH